MIEFVTKAANGLQVRWTQRAIKQVLTERYYSWREADILAKSDPEIDLSGNGPIYTPMEFEEDIDEAELEEAQFEGDAKAEQEIQEKGPVVSEVKTEQRISPNA